MLLGSVARGGRKWDVGQRRKMHVVPRRCHGSNLCKAPDHIYSSPLAISFCIPKQKKLDCLNICLVLVTPSGKSSCFGGSEACGNASSENISSVVESGADVFFLYHHHHSSQYYCISKRDSKHGETFHVVARVRACVSGVWHRH